MSRHCARCMKPATKTHREKFEYCDEHYAQALEEDAVIQRHAKKLTQEIMKDSDHDKGAFKGAKNQDGTFNGFKVMSNLSGIPEQEVRQTWADLKDYKEKHPNATKQEIKDYLNGKLKHNPPLFKD